MNLRYLAGWGFLVLAFLAAAFESAARGRLDSEVGFVLSSQELLSAYRPELLRTAQEWVEGTLHWALWDPVLVTFLLLPAWAFLGIPGIYLVLRYRPPGGQGEDIDEDQFFMFDRLSKRASEEGYDEYEDDISLNEHIKKKLRPRRPHRPRIDGGVCRRLGSPGSPRQRRPSQKELGSDQIPASCPAREIPTIDF